MAMQLPDKQTLIQYSIWGALGASAGAFVIGIALLALFFFQVYFGDDSYLKKSTILAKINEETAIYFLDEKTRIGSFFDEHHRRYVPIEEAPAHLINSVVASEDKYFYEHNGVNPVAIFKAISEGMNLFFTTGKIHFRGGSTITQQTVKNILDRKEYSIMRKFREAVAALQLERLYSKKQILEFYLNQFHVAANGNGIGIAARYYFNKEVRDLDLVEAAFIAGSVKGPSKYNPFIKYTPEARKTAVKFANGRKNYVLRRMLEQGWITEDEFKEAYEQPVPFNKGRFTTREVALVSLIRGQLDKKEILEAMGMDSIDELNRAGLNIYTTLDAELQELGQLQMRRNLSKLETILQGYHAEEPDNYRPLRELDVGEFYFGKVEKIVRKDTKPTLSIDFGLPKGTVPHESLVRYAKLMDIAVPKGDDKRMEELLTSVRIGDVLYFEVREYNKDTHEAVLELHKRPMISGGLIALDRGEVRTLISGFDPQGYNRAIFATRQPGSVFKVVSYFAALQLGWSILDRLDNDRRVFPYQGQFYYPRPDHDSPYREVSMIWSGAQSENLAAVYLTARLIEKLNFNQFKGLLGVMGLLPNEGEAKRDYHFRVARKLGVQLDNEGIREFQLQNAVNDLGPDLIFSGDQELLRQMQKMWWGRGYSAELQRVYATDIDELGDQERMLRVALVKNNYQRHLILATQLEDDWQRITSKVSSQGPESLQSDPELVKRLTNFRVIPSRSNLPSLGYFRNMPEEEPLKGSTELKASLEAFPGRPLNALDIKAIWGGASFFTTNANINLNDVRLSGYLPLGRFRDLQKRLDERYQTVMAIQEPYDLPYYYQHHDFRIAIGLNYLKMLCEAMGVFSAVEPVLSFPLGTNVVSVAEVAKIYQTLVEGKVYSFYKEGPPNQLNFIRRIEDRFGNILFEPKKEEFQLVMPSFSEQVRQILRKVITHGTGGRARGELYVSTGGNEGKKQGIVRVPAFGKTGTTNDYRTASFAGFLPYPSRKGEALDPTNSYVLTSYVGYDFNREMKRGGFKVSGAFGALPVWTDFAKSIIENKKYVEFLDNLDLKVLARGEWPLKNDDSSVAAKVDLPRGVVLRGDENVDSEKFETTNLDVTGEEFVNEFSSSASVKSIVYIPKEGSSSDAGGFRMVSPFVRREKDEDIKGAEVSPEVQDSVAFPSTVDPNAVRNFSSGNTSSSPGNDERRPDTAAIEANQPPTLPDNSMQKDILGVPPLDAAAERKNIKPAPADEVREEISKRQKQNREEPARPRDGGNDDPGYIEDELW